MFLTLAQILALVINIIFYFQRDKKNFLIWAFLANLSAVIVMVLAQETDGWANSLAVLLRSTLFLGKDKYKTYLPYFIGLGLHIVAFTLSFQNAWSILLGMATITICTAHWWGTAKVIKVATIFSDTCWAIYVLYIGLFLDAPRHILGVILMIISLIRDKKALDKY